MSAAWIRRWSFVHRWTSLLCTLFLLAICLTGLPLVFKDEIAGWLDDDPPYAVLPPDTPAASIDAMVAEAMRRHPDDRIAYVFVDDDEPQAIVAMAPSWQAFAGDPRSRRFLKFDARTGGLLKESGPSDQQQIGFLRLMLRLHQDLFAGLPGELFVGAMGLLFVAALVSGGRYRCCHSVPRWHLAARPFSRRRAPKGLVLPRRLAEDAREHGREGTRRGIAEIA